MSQKKRRARPTPAAVPPAGGRRRDWILIAILVAAAAARVGVLIALRSHPLLQPRPGLDSGVYLELARQVAGGDLLCGSRVFFVSPFYVYFAGAALALSGGSVLGLQLLQALLGVAAVWLVADTARLWFGARGAWIAGGLAGAAGYFAFQESLLLQSSVDPFLTALGLWALARAWTNPVWQRFLVAGVALGLHALNRPNILAWAVAAAALTLVIPRTRRGTGKHGRPRLQRARHAGTLLAGFIVVLLPVGLRNYAVGGEFALVSSHGGLNFYIGNNARADGTYRLVPGITPSIEGQDRDMRRVAGEANGRPMTDVEASTWFYRQAAAWMTQHPAAAAALFARKLAYVFNAEDIPLNDSYAYYATDEPSPLRVLVVGPWLLLPLGLAGIWLGRPARTPAGTDDRGDAWWRWVSFVPVYAVSVAVFFVTGRYRLPILVACCVTGAGCVLALVEQARTRRWRKLAAPSGVLLLLAAATNLDLGLDNGLAGWRSEMILHDIASGDDAAAEALLARTEPMFPNRPLLLYRVGRAYRERGDGVRALAVLERARALAPERREVALEMGEVLLGMGRASEAIGFLEAGRDTGGREDEARLALARARVTTGDANGGIAELAALRAPEALDAGAQLAAGRLALDQGQAALAEPFLARAARGAPANPEAQESYGLALAAAGKRSEAIGAFEAASRLDPSNAGVLMNLAILYADAGRFQEARRRATEAVRLRPDDTRARQFLASLPPGR